MLARKAAPQAGEGGGGGRGGLAGPLQQPAPGKVVQATVTEGHRLQQQTSRCFTVLQS